MDADGWAPEALAGSLEVNLVNHHAMSEYRPRAARGDPPREAASPQAPNDGLGNYTSGSVGNPRISPLGDMTKARNDRKLGVLTDLPASSTSAAILATEVIVVTAHPNEGPKSLSMTRER